jgi:hypothetical protein
MNNTIEKAKRRQSQAIFWASVFIAMSMNADDKNTLPHFTSDRLGLTLTFISLG